MSLELKVFVYSYRLVKLKKALRTDVTAISFQDIYIYIYWLHTYVCDLLIHSSPVSASKTAQILDNPFCQITHILNELKRQRLYISSFSSSLICLFKKKKSEMTSDLKTLHFNIKMKPSLHFRLELQSAYSHTTCTNNPAAKPALNRSNSSRQTTVHSRNHLS